MSHIPRGRPLAVAAAVLIAAAATAIAVTGAASAATSVVYEAENGALSGGASVATDHTGYVGTGFVGGYIDGNKGKARTTFAVTAAGQQTLSLRYANGTGSAQTLSLYVNGTKARQISLPATAGWDSWATVSATASFATNSNTVAYAFDTTDSGNVNLDDLTVTPAAATPAGQLEAESATLTGGAVAESDHTGYTGTGFVGGYTDGNKGNAATTFAVNSAAAGAAPLSLRYANGTGSAQTLSLYVNGAKVQPVSLPATANWDTWTTQSVTASLLAGANTVAVKFDATDSGNVNLDNLTVGTTVPTTPTTPPPGSGGPSAEAETAFFSGGPAVSTAVGGYSGTGHLTGFTATGARVIFTANLPSAGSRTATLRYSNTSGSAATLSVYANGLKAGQVSLPSGAGWQTAGTGLALRAGLNTVTYQHDAADSGNVAIDRLDVTGALALADRGATLPYTEYEAESGTTNGTVLAADRTYKTLASESSGRRAVQLTATGSYVQFTLTKPANALTVRYSIPDTGADATLSLYANGSQVKDLALSSRYAWVYGDYPYNNNPASGNAHRFYDEARTLIGDWPAGTVLKLQKDAGDTASAYTIDLVDAEQATPEAMPAGFVSAAAPGATPDDTASLNTAINTARSAGKGLWIPAGTYTISGRINVQGVTIRGAGPWYTILKGVNGKGGFFATGGNVQITDLAVSGDSTVRNDSGDDAAFEGNFGTGSLLQNILVFHSKVGLWADNGTDGLYVVGIRIRDTYADGVNLHGNVRNTRIDQSSVRNTGDDALAMWSDGSAVTNSAFTANTLQLPMLGNTAGIYGGNSNRITDNLMSDTVTASAGIAVGTRFNPVPLSGTTVVARNTLTRTGGYEPNWASPLGALWIYADTADITSPIQVTDTVIKDSTYMGILMSYGRTITGTTFSNVTVENTGTYGIVIDSISGSATFTGTKVSGTPSGGLSNPGTTFTVIRGAGNSGF